MLFSKWCQEYLRSFNRETGVSDCLEFNLILGRGAKVYRGIQWNAGKYVGIRPKNPRELACR